MSKRKQTSASTAKTKDVGDHRIEYRRIDDIEEVKIDGQIVPFFRVGESYVLEVAAYAPKQPTLVDAAVEYVKRMPGREE